MRVCTFKYMITAITLELPIISTTIFIKIQLKCAFLFDATLSALYTITMIVSIISNNNNGQFHRSRAMSLARNKVKNSVGAMTWDDIQPVTKPLTCN